MNNTKDDNLQNMDFRKVEWNIAESIRSEFHQEDVLSYKVCIAALAIVFKKTNNKEAMMEYLEIKIKNDATIKFLKKLAKDHYKYIEELSDKYSIEELEASVLFSEPNRFTEVDTNSTPEGIAKLAINILKLEKDDVVLDLGSGVNSFLNQVAESSEVKKMYGVEINTTNVIIANVRSFVAGVPVEVIQGNILSQDFSQLSPNKVFSNHPLGMRLRDLQSYIEKNLKLKKFFNEAKRTASGDWVFNMAAYLNTKQPGKTVVLMTNAGTWNKPDEELRQMLIEKGIIEGIILLPERLLSITRIPLTMMIFSENNKDVKMVDASQIYTEGRRQNSLEEADIIKIAQAYNDTTDISRDVSISEISKQEYILNPQRYIGMDTGIKDPILLGDASLSINRGAMIRSAEIDEISSVDETNYRYLMLQNIQDGVIDTNLPSLLEIEEKYKKHCIKDNNLIVSKLSPFKVAMARVKDDEEILANGNLYFIELDNSIVNPTFVEAFLQSETGMAQLNRYAKGSSMKSISIQDLKMIQIPNLPLEEQDKIAEEYQNLCDELVILKRQSEMIQDRKSRLLEEVI